MMLSNPNKEGDYLAKWQLFYINERKEKTLLEKNLIMKFSVKKNQSLQSEAIKKAPSKKKKKFFQTINN